MKSQLVLALLSLSLPLTTISSVDKHSLALRVHGEAIFRTTKGTHPGTPVGIRRENMVNAASPAHVLNLSLETNEMQSRGFGPLINFMDDKRSLGSLGIVHGVDPTDEEVTPMFFVYTLNTVNGEKQPFVIFSASIHGLIVYDTSRPSWWDFDGNKVKMHKPPRPVAAITSDGIVYAKGFGYIF